MSVHRALIAGAAVAALSGLNFNDGVGGGLSNADIADIRARKKAKADRETWDIDPTESRQVRRARERKAAGKPNPDRNASRVAGAGSRATKASIVPTPNPKAPS